MADMNRPVLTIDGLSIHFPTSLGLIHAVEDFHLTIAPGERWGLLGESGCGKTVLAMSIPRLLPATAAVAGRIDLNGHDVLAMPTREIRRLRGRTVGMIFEQPTCRLDPMFTVGDQIAEGIRAHETVSRRAARQRAVELLRQVRIPSPEHRARQYPHQLSGGMRQRVMIAIALALRPRLMVADEPTTSLDVSVQRQIIDLLDEVLEEIGAALLLITHDRDVVQALCRWVIIMYAGQMVEKGELVDVFARPAHPYTRALLSALSGNQPRPIPGQPPSLADPPSGCRFHPRCEHALASCSLEPPPFDGQVRCVL